jgi:predicted SnoaL-like aldol condensation-catalyzing enzyme/predicted small secreted protein
MKFIFLLVVAASFTLVSCNNNTDSGATADKKDTTAMAKPTESKQERNKKIVMASVEAMNAHNLDVMLKDAAPDALDYGDGSGKPMKGVDSIKKMIGEWWGSFPDAKSENVVYAADGDWVFVWSTETGTFKNDMGKTKATGKSYKYQDVEVFKLNDDGKITEHHSIQPGSTMMSQIMPTKK